MIVKYGVIPASSPEYPGRLRSILSDAPLYALGNLGLLGRRAIGICGSREASPEAQRYAFEFGIQAAKHSFVVVGGYARGADRQAHRGALEAGGATIAVLPEGVNHFRVVPELKDLVDLGSNFLAISMFDPDAVWMSWRAMERNKLIVGLSVALFVVEAQDKGGTLNAAMECMQQRKPFWVFAYSKEISNRAGSRKLLETGATPLRCEDDLRKALEKSASKSPEEVNQLALNLL